MIREEKKTNERKERRSGAAGRKEGEKLRGKKKEEERRQAGREEVRDVRSKGKDSSTREMRRKGGERGRMREREVGIPL